jgi:hypothetical protein
MEQNIRSELTEEISTLQKKVESKAKTQSQKILSDTDTEIAALEEQGKKSMKKTLDFIIQAVYAYGGSKK